MVMQYMDLYKEEYEESIIEILPYKVRKGERNSDGFVHSFEAKALGLFIYYFKLGILFDFKYYQLYLKMKKNLCYKL